MLPSNPRSLNAGGGFGRVVVRKQRYRPDLRRRHLQVPLNCGEPVDGAIQVLDGALARLNQQGVTYNVFGPNSNSVGPDPAGESVSNRYSLPR